MKKTLLSGIFLMSCIAVQAQHEYTIDGSIKGLKDGAVMILFLSDGRVGNSVGVDTVRNESFHFKRNAGTSGMDKLSLMASSPGFFSMALDLYATPDAKIKISGSDNYIYTWKVESPVKEQRELSRYTDYSRDLWKLYQELSIKADSAKSAEEHADLKKKQDSISSVISGRDIALMQKLPITNIWMNKLLRLSLSVSCNPEFKYKVETIELYNRLSEAQKASIEGREISVNLFPPVAVKEGDEMVDADLFSLDGKVHHLANYKGKYMLLDFWSSGCGPCIIALPEMKEIQEKYKDKLLIISISSDTKSQWEKASMQHNITWTNLNDLKQTTGLYAQYGVRGIPNYVLISPEGRIIKMWAGYGQGSLKQKMRKFIDSANQEMIITRQGNTKIVRYPKVKSSNTDIIEVKQVELTDTATILHIKAYYIPNYWIEMSPQVVIMTDDGASYPLKKADGIILGEHFFLPESGEAEFTLTFKPLPANTHTFNLTEGDEEGKWQLKGIKLAK